MSPLLVTKHRSSLPVVRHEKKPWVISRTAGLADFVFFRAPWNVPPRWWPQFPQLGGLLRLKYSTWHLGHEPRPRLLITNTNQEQTHTTRKPYNKRFTRLKKMKLNLTRKPNNNKRLTHVQVKQIKTQSKNLLITTKPNKNDPNTSNRWKPEEKTQFSSKRTSRRWSRTGEASFTSWNGSVRRVTIRVLDCSLDNDHDYRKRPCSQSLTSLQMVQASCFRFLCCHLQNVFLPFGKRQDEFHLIEEVLHLTFQLQRYVDFHNCFKISQKTFWTFVANLLPSHFVYGRKLISHANFADISWWEAWDIL